jgi:hypothetical protein
MHELKHLVVVSPGMVFDPVKAQRVGRAAATLVKRRDETGTGFYLPSLFSVNILKCGVA